MKSPLLLFRITPSLVLVCDQSFSNCLCRRKLIMTSFRTKLPGLVSAVVESAKECADIGEGDLVAA